MCSKSPGNFRENLQILKAIRNPNANNDQAMSTVGKVTSIIATQRGSLLKHSVGKQRVVILGFRGNASTLARWPKLENWE